MKTALFTNMFLRGFDPFAVNRLRIMRAEKFLRYYEALQSILKIDQIYVTENGGAAEHISFLLHIAPHIKLIRHPFLQRGQGHDYLPCWRTTHDYQIAIHDGFEKLILLDDDAYIISRKLMDHVRKLESGWEALYCPRHDLPETGLSVMCKDAFPAYFEYLKVPYRERNHQDNLIERILPYTSVNRDFIADRYGESRLQQAWDMDAYFQCPTDIEIKAQT